MKKIMLFIVSFFFIVTLLNGEEFTLETLSKELLKHSASFKEILIKDVNTSVSFEINLGNSSIKINENHEYNVIRFKIPDEGDLGDFVWYFNAPSEWGNWFIVPMKGEIKGGFTEWLIADKVYENLDKAGEKERVRILQTLKADYFKKGQEYYIWFRKMNKSDGIQILRGIFSFAKKNEKWDFESIENALLLKPKDEASQVEALNSRGGKILLNKELFNKDDAKSRINDVFFSIRNTSKLPGGFHLTTEIHIPPCQSNVSLADVIKKYGEPDFIISANEMKEAMNHQIENGQEKIVTYHYDYFGFEVKTDNPNKKIERVVSHATNYSSLIPKDNKAYFMRILIKNLTVFYIGKVEVGRIYYFLEGGKKPLIIKAPPLGEYMNNNDTIELLANDNWIWKSYYPDKKLAREIPFINHRMEGTANGYYANGKKSFTATYTKGVLNGTLIQYSEKGDETQRLLFENGERKE